MKKVTGGVLPYRFKNGVLEVLLGRPGGPYWRVKGPTNWTIFKGGVKKKESIRDAAIREFLEETGAKKAQLDFEKLIELGTSQTKAKIVYCYGLECDLDPKKLKSNEFKLEWPPNSGSLKSFEEINAFKWYNLEEAMALIMDSQKPFLNRLLKMLNK